jgi:hypothetical protein
MRTVLFSASDLRHAHDHRDAPLVHAPDDVVRVEAPHEDDRAVDERRDVGGHRLPEQVAQGQQVEAIGERAAVISILSILATGRREDVAMTNDDAFDRLAPMGRRSRDVVAIGDRRHGSSAVQESASRHAIAPASTSSPTRTTRA